MRTESWYREKLFKAGVPQHMHDAYVLYLLHGIEPGDFLLSVLANDLGGAVGRADSVNVHALREHVLFLYNDVPSTCWGSRDRVRDWLRSFEAPETPPADPAVVIQG